MLHHTVHFLPKFGSIRPQIPEACPNSFSSAESSLLRQHVLKPPFYHSTSNNSFKTMVAVPRSLSLRKNRLSTINLNVERQVLKCRIRSINRHRKLGFPEGIRAARSIDSSAILVVRVNPSDSKPLEPPQ